MWDHGVRRRLIEVSYWGGKPRFAYCYMAKLAIDSASLEYLVINREIFIPNLEVGRFSNRETWKLCDRVDT